MNSLADKARKQTRFLLDYLHTNFRGSVEVITPVENSDERGGQLSLRLSSHGKRVQEALIAADVICDWREPDCIRIAFAPLYNRFTDGVRFLRILHKVLDNV